MPLNIRLKIAALAAASLVGIGQPAFATSTWGFQQPGLCTQNATNKDNFGNSWNCAPTGSGDPSLVASAWSNTLSGAKYAVANLDDNAGSGFGVKNQTEGLNVASPNHSLDNSVNNDMMLLSFASSVVLKQLTLGWYSGDSDVTVLRYTGTSAPVFVNLGAGDLLANGWALVGNYADLGTNATNINAAGANSSWWLISAYNSTFGSGAGLSAGDDYIKVLSVAGDKSIPGKSVPEPGSLALVTLALFGAAGTRRLVKKPH